MAPTPNSEGVPPPRKTLATLASRREVEVALEIGEQRRDVFRLGHASGAHAS